MAPPDEGARSFPDDERLKSACALLEAERLARRTDLEAVLAALGVEHLPDLAVDELLAAALTAVAQRRDGA